MPTNIDDYYHSASVTVLQAANELRCNKHFYRKEDGSVGVISNAMLRYWKPTAFYADTIDKLFTVLSTIAILTNQCAIRGALARHLADAEQVVRISRPPTPTFVEVPRIWMAIDVDKLTGTLQAFYTALHTALPMFDGVSHIVQRSSSFGMTPGKLSIRLWYMSDAPATGEFWHTLLGPHANALGIDISMYQTIRIHFTAAPTFDSVPDPCVERWTLTRGLFDEVSTNAYPTEIRLARPNRSTGIVADPPITGNAEQIEAAISRILLQQPRNGGTGHDLAQGAGGELYALGCPMARAIPVMDMLIPRGHGREPNVGESEGMWDWIAGKSAAGQLRTSNPPLSQVFAAVPELPPLTAEQVAETEQQLEANNIGEWGGDIHVNGRRYERMFFRGFIHWNGADFQLNTEGFWSVLENQSVLDMRVCRDTRLSHARASNIAHAIRSRNLREFLDPPCDIRTNRRLDDVITFQNGYMLVEEVKRGVHTLRPHDINHFSLSVLGANYNPAATCPRFDQFLTEVFPNDQAAQTQILRLMAYLLVPDISFQKFFMLVGASGSGKSTLAQLINAILGAHNVASVSNMDSLIGDFGLAPLLGKSLCYLPEANAIGGGARTSRAVANVIKLISGGDHVLINRKNLPQISTRLPTRLVSICNTPPELGDDSGALMRRMMVIRFPISFSDAPERGLEQTLISEREGVINRLLAEMPGLYGTAADCGFHVPDSAREDCEFALRNAAPVASFIADCLMPNANGLVLNSDLNRVCQRWCAENSIPPISSILVSRSLQRISHTRRTVSEMERGHLGVSFSVEGQRLLAISF